MASEDLYLGFDLSTQQLKAIVINSKLKLIHEAKVDFDQDFGQKYGVQKGVLRHDDLGEIFSPVAMWLEAIDLVLSRLKEQGLDFSKIKGLSGAGMQHGTVFWNKDAERFLQNRDSSKSLLESLEAAFSSPHSPNWQDASTQSQCEEFDALLGSPEKLAEVTGSKAHHRFSGPQIMRLRQTFPERYAATARISIVSSYISSVFLDHVASIDIGDVCGMNLWNISDGCWDDRLLALVAGSEDKVEHLKNQLGEVSHDGGATLGTISSYFVQKYNFPRDCSIIAATGDNPATILSLPLQPSDAIVSLGTSTTFLMSTPNYKPDPQYHFMNHPTTKGLYMFMLCYKNGGLAREHIRDGINSTAQSSSKHTWQRFNEKAFEAPPLNQSDEADSMKLGLYFPLPEIVPKVDKGTWRCLYRPYNKSDRPKLEFLDSSFNDDGDGGDGEKYTEIDARTIIESQFLSLRLRSKNLVTPQRDPQTGRSLPPQPRRIYLVGGGSVNPVITQICGQVLGGSEGVYRLDVGGNACALGAAHKAVWGCERSKDEKFEDFIGSRWNEDEFVKRVADGYQEGIWEKYEIALRGFEEMEREVVKRAGVDLKPGEQVVGTRKD